MLQDPTEVHTFIGLLNLQTKLCTSVENTNMYHFLILNQNLHLPGPAQVSQQQHNVHFTDKE